jgi:cytochrome c-type biogenesis protein CcmH/NrfF
MNKTLTPFPLSVRARGFRGATSIQVVLFCAIMFGMLGFVGGATTVCAQDDTVTLDDVNAIATRLYCPVCPNETLASCRTEACVRWREEIRQQLAAGMTEQQVIDDFIARYGERVVGTPEDPTLRALSVYTPYVLLGLAVLLGGFTLLRWRRGRATTPTDDTPLMTDSSNHAYRAQLERDLLDE